jgi:adenylate cyclase 10
LEKKSDANISWAPRFVLLSSRELKYYYSKEDCSNGIEALGTIPLKSIFGVQPLNEREKGNKSWAFQIQASSWWKKSVEMPVRTFYFAASSEDLLEEWSIYLEFTKAKAVYDDFVNNFGKISFPLG